VATESTILSWVLGLPAVGGGLVFALPAAHARKARGVAMAFLGATLVLTGMAAGWVDYSQGGELQLVMRGPWLRAVGAGFSLGVDGLSMPLMLLVAGMGVMACWASYGVGRSPRAYFGLLVWLVTAALAVFAAADLVLLAAAVAVMLVPLYFLVGGWGGPRREYAASKLFLFSKIAAVLLLLAAVGVYRATRAGGTGGGANGFDLPRLVTDPALAAQVDAGGLAGAEFGLLLAAFGILMAVAPVHTWLADVLAEAAAPVAMLTAAAVPAVGAYGLMRVAYPLLGVQAAGYWPWVAALGAATILYGALGALAQRDLRRVVAFAAVAQAGYVLLGVAVLSPTAAAGAAYALVGNGIALGMLVFVSGMIADRAGHCDLRRLGGLGGHMPVFAGWSAVGFLAAAGLPGLCGFVGPLLVLLGTFAGGRGGGPGTAATAWLAVLAAGGLVLTGACWVWTYQRVFLGAPKPEHSNVARLSSSEKWILAAFAVLAVVLGVMPGLVLDAVRGWAAGWMR
jgi:NADH-quinone oxidoreductase subunit M